MKKPKIQLVKEHLLSGKSITGLQALRLYGYYRLSSGINRLNNRGMNIESDKSNGYSIYKLKK